MVCVRFDLSIKAVHRQSSEPLGSLFYCQISPQIALQILLKISPQIALQILLKISPLIALQIALKIFLEILTEAAPGYDWQVISNQSAIIYTKD